MGRLWNPSTFGRWWIMGKTKKTFMAFDKQDKWLVKKSEELGVDQSLLIRRALKYYKDRGMVRDNFLKQQTDEEIKP